MIGIGRHLSVTQLQAMQEQNRLNAVKAATCMRAHGIVNFPDPKGTSVGCGMLWPTLDTTGIDFNSPQYQAAYKICGRHFGGPIPPVFAPGSGGGDQGPALPGHRLDTVFTDGISGGDAGRHGDDIRTVALEITSHAYLGRRHKEAVPAELDSMAPQHGAYEDQAGSPEIPGGARRGA
jgi:hypothetical protein